MAINPKNSIDEQDAKQKKINRSKNHTNCLASAAMAINTLHDHGRLLDVPTLMNELTESSERVTAGNITEIEQMLMTQAKMLDYIFYDSLNYLSDLNMTNQVELISNIAFRAQSQCRKTLSTLAELKHPRRAIFVKQQNNAVINQQVNNAVKHESNDFINSKKVANELLEIKENGQWMDARAQTETIANDAEMEALGVLNRSQNPAR